MRITLNGNMKTENEFKNILFRLSRRALRVTSLVSWNEVEMEQARKKNKVHCRCAVICFFFT